MAFIEMEHRDIDGVASADEAAFRDVWSRKGWTKVTKSSRKKSSAQIQTEAQEIADAEAEGYAEAEAEYVAEREQKKAKAKERAKARSKKRLEKDGKK